MRLPARRRRPPPAVPLPIEDALGDHLAAVAELGDEDLHSVQNFVDALITRARLKTLAGGKRLTLPVPEVAAPTPARSARGAGASPVQMCGLD